MAIWTEITFITFLYKRQYSYRKVRSISQDINKFASGIAKGFEDNGYTFGVFLGLSKAFDIIIIDHNVLIHKLGLSLDWFRNYPNERKHFTIFKWNIIWFHGYNM